MTENTQQLPTLFYELDGDTLTIWGGVLAGGWVSPGDGGYDSTATRVK